MKKSAYVIFLSIFVLLMAGCIGCYPTPVGYDEPDCPGYVYTYAGGCWADDVWYSPCPWTPGPSYGYYGWYAGGWRFHAGVTWRYLPGYPPPRYIHPPYYAPRPYYPTHPHPGYRGRRF